MKSSRESFRNGNWNTEEIIKTRVQWEPRAGTIDRKYNNVAVPALADYTHYIKKLGKFRLNDAVRYNKEALENSFVRIPNLSPENAWPLAQDNLNRIAQKECREAVAADHFRNYSVHTGYTSPNWTQLLLPTYFTYYTDDDGSPVPIYIHGQTGKIAGPRLASQRKGWKWAGISMLIALGLFLMTLLFSAGSALLPVLSILALILGVLAFIAAIFAVIPAVYPWQWNRRQQDKIIVMISNQDQPNLDH
ncbi:MAG: hypothetical protein K8R77_15895 [Anaerolineaceae bacterium]|nr:hypothetical protein [Anaerolineaceae bacterium]